MELTTMSLVLSMVGAESVDSSADGERGVNVSDESWRATTREGVSSGASDGKTSASESLSHR